MITKTDMMFACAWYATLWGPTYGREERIGRIARRVRLGCLARLENEDSGVKMAYGRLVREYQSLYTGFQRLARRYPDVTPSWPGTRNMPNGTRAWLKSQGLLEAVESMVQP